MKTLAITAAALLMSLSFTGFAADRNSKDRESVKVKTNFPKIVSTYMSDLNEKEIESLKLVLLKSPEFIVGSPEDINVKEIENLKTVFYELKRPAINTTDSEDVDQNEINLLKK